MIESVKRLEGITIHDLYETSDVMHFAEFGVVLMLFLIELEPSL